MHPATRGAITLLICLLAVFPCGAALTVLGTFAAEAVRVWSGHAHSSEKLSQILLPTAWAAAGVLGFLSLIHGVDRLMAAQRRLPWYVLLGLLLGIGAAGFFSLTYPLHSTSATFLRVVCVAPVAIELLLWIFHVGRFIRGSQPADQLHTAPAAVMSSTAQERTRL